jgi:DNA primase
MDISTFNQTTDLVALVGRNLRKVGAYHVGSCPFCGGRDRFVIKRTPKGDRWYCRHCGDEKYHTPIDFVMRRDQVDFKTALRSLGGEVRLVKSQPQRIPAKPPLALPDLSWQKEAWRLVDAASRSLESSQEGQAGRDYLTGRGFHRGTWIAHHLGFAIIFDPKAKRKRPAIVLPWWDCDIERSMITAVKHRFIDDDPSGLRYISHRGSVPILYGLWSAIPEHNTLLLVEGEINALSIWQCIPEGVTCLSFGSENGVHIDRLETLAKRYQKLIVWADNPKRSSELRKVLGTQTQAWQSPVVDDMKWDANKMLQEDVLMEFLTRKLTVSCQGYCTKPS